jgi:hypothetical protein
LFIRVYDGDVEITVEQTRERIFILNFINNPVKEHMEFCLDKDTMIQLQAKLQVIVENSD